MIKLRDLFLDALEDSGYNVPSAIEYWNTTLKPEILSLPSGKHVYHVGRHEITFTKV